MFLVEQQVYLWVGNVLLLWEEVTLHCIEMVVQHLHLGVLHGIEFMSFGLVVMMVMGVVDVGFFSNPFSLAWTSFLARLFAFLRQTHGLGTSPSSVGVGFIICLSFWMSRSGVYSVLKNVSYLICFPFCFASRVGLFWKGTCFRVSVNR